MSDPLGGPGSPIALAVSGSSRAELRAELARFFGYVEGVATGGTTSTILDTSLFRYPDDYFVGAQVWIEDADGAAPEDETSYVTDFANSTGTLTLLPVLTAEVDSGDTYHIYQTVTKDDMDKAIAKACAGGEATYALAVDTTTLDYDLTHIMGLRNSRSILAVVVRDGDDTQAQPYMLKNWYIEDSFGQLTLHLFESPSADDALWIVYLLDESGMNDDAMRCNLPSGLVLARARVRLLEDLLPKQDQSGMDKYGQLLRYWQDEVKKEERKYQPATGRVRKTPWRSYVPDSGASERHILRTLGLEWIN